MLCQECRTSLLDTNKRVYVCKNEECSPDFENGAVAYWCSKCKETTDCGHKREKYKPQKQFEEDEEGGDGTKYLDKLL